jgi:lipoprotein
MIKVERQGLDYIEKYLKNHMGSYLTVSCGIQVYEGFKYWARFEEPDEYNDDYTHYVHAEGNTLEEVAGKIAAYIDSGKIYNDGRYV